MQSSEQTVELKPKTGVFKGWAGRLRPPSAVWPYIMGKIKQRREESGRPVFRQLGEVRCKLKKHELA